MAKERHEGPGGDPFLDAVDAECMAKHVRGDRLGDPGFVGHSLDDPLNGAGTDAGIIMLSKMMID